MSRTFRRKGDKKRNKSGSSHFVEDYTTTYDTNNEDCLYTCWGARGSVPLEGHAYWKAYWRYHGDQRNSYGWGNYTYDRVKFEVRCRMKNKQELNRYMKDNEYEVMTHKPGCLSWER